MLKKPKLEKLLKEFEKETDDFYAFKRAEAYFKIGIIKSVLGKDTKEYINKIFEAMPGFIKDRIEHFLMLYELEQTEDESLGILTCDRESWKPMFCKLMLKNYFGLAGEDEDFKKAYPFIEAIYDKREKYY